MKHYFQKAKGSLLVKTGFFNGIATFIRIIVGVVSTKVVAVLLGPSGVALLGNFNNTFTLLSTFGGGGINSGVTKYVAEYKNTPKLKGIIQNAVFISLFSTTVVSIVIILFRKYFAEQIFYSLSYSWIFIVLAISLPFINYKLLFTAIFNGHKDFFKIIATNIVFSFINLGITIFLVWKYSLIGAVLAVMISGILTTFVIVYLMYRAEWINTVSFFPKFEKENFKKLIKFSLMSFISLFFASFIQLTIRKYIIANISMDIAGYWEAVTKLVNMFLSMFTMTLSIYFLPRFSEIVNKMELRNEVVKAILLMSPFILVGGLIIFSFRDFIIITLFSPSFLPMKPLFLFQLIGGYFQIISWVFSYILVAKAMTRAFILIEIVFGSSYFVLFILFINFFGIVGATYAYALNYLLYLICLLFIFKRI